MSAAVDIAVNWRHEAERFYRSGLRVIPFWNTEDGRTGFPAAWSRYADCPLDELRSDDFWLRYGERAEGLALIMTDDLEAIDVDTKADPERRIFTDFVEAIRATGADDILARTVAVVTKNKGAHLVYRAANRQGNQKLASRLADVDGRKRHETLIETRGSGGLLFVAPTPGYKVMNEHYTAAPRLTDEQRNLLIQIARSCCRLPKAERPEARKEARALRTLPAGEGKTPWEAYNESHDVLELLEAQGWTRVNESGDYIRINRPGHPNPRDIGGSVIKSANVFYPFTSNTQYEPNTGYSPFAVYAHEVHGGDYSAAARALYADGFGDRRGPASAQRLDGSAASLTTALASVVPAEEKPPVDAADELTALLAEVDDKHTFALHRAAEKIDYVMHYHSPVTGRVTGMCAQGMFGLMVGLQKSGKTTLLSAFVVAALTGRPYLNFTFDLKGKSILWLDCEQPREWFEMTCRRIYRLAGLEDNSPRFRGVSLRRYSKAQRAAITGALILREPNLGMAIVDGLVDICQDFNDVVASEATVDKILEWSDRSGALIWGVIHLTKGMGFVKGHLGTISQNKADLALETSKGDAGGAFRCRHREARGPAIDDFEFFRNDHGDPVTREEYEAATLSGATLPDDADEWPPPANPYGSPGHLAAAVTAGTNKELF